ncbi:hypothetical protein HAX54_028142 [Datura stramonium]|uniref:Uncharacterized protein n=1 Tax=Datura stramonium TaxID=4076 RepID=A0ABS8V4S3_DATST|nr:hypothetical protein [Datura stramonium]
MGGYHRSYHLTTGCNITRGHSNNPEHFYESHSTAPSHGPYLHTMARGTMRENFDKPLDDDELTLDQSLHEMEEYEGKKEEKDEKERDNKDGDTIFSPIDYDLIDNE